MEPADPLAALRDIRLPHDPSWWPPAPGWWLLGLVVLSLAVLAARALLRRRRVMRPLVAARHMLAHIESDLARDGDHDRAVRRLSVLLRRYLLARFPDAGPAALSGRQWARYVASVAHGTGPEDDDLDTLLDAPYRPGASDASSYAALVRSVLAATASPRSSRGSEAS